MDQQQLYLELYKEYRNEIRHQETQRSAVSTICVGLAAGLIGLSFTAQDKSAKVYLGYLLVNFTVVAILILRKLYERFVIGRERAALYLAEIDKCPKMLVSQSGALGPPLETCHLGLRDVWINGRTNIEERYPFMSFVRLHHLWESLLIAAFVVGLIFTVQYPVMRSSSRCLALAFAGPGFQMLILVCRQWWEKNVAFSQREHRADGAFLAIDGIRTALRCRLHEAAQRIYVWIHQVTIRGPVDDVAAEHADVKNKQGFL